MMMGNYTDRYPLPTPKPLTKSPSAVYRWWTFGLGIAGISFFLFFLGPMLTQLPIFEPLATVIDEKNIEAGMYFYTDVELFSEAQLNINNSMDFPAQQR